MTAPIEVVHEDEHLLVVAKPPGIATTAPGDGHSFTRVLRGQWRKKAGQRELHATSRLDSPVSGLVTYAQTDAAIRSLKAAREAGRYERLYLALAPSAPEPAEGEWAWPIGIDPNNPRQRVVGRGHEERLQNARTLYSTVERAEGGVLLALRPQTGRTHQLRVHSAEAKCPLYGDVAYGGTKRHTQKDGRVLSARRVMLHCTALRIPNIARGGDLELRLAPPPDFESLWLGLGGSAASLLAPL